LIFRPAHPAALLLTIPVIDVAILRVTQLILVVDFKFLWRLGSVVDLTRWRLIFPRAFIVAVIVIIRSAAARVIGEFFEPRADHMRS
jgi:hypothetical protein